MPDDAQDQRHAAAGEHRAGRPDERARLPEGERDLDHRAGQDRGQDLRDADDEAERDLAQHVDGDDDRGHVQARIADVGQHDRVAACYPASARARSCLRLVPLRVTPRRPRRFDGALQGHHGGGCRTQLDDRFRGGCQWHATTSVSSAHRKSRSSGACPTCPGIGVAMRLTPQLGLHLRGLADQAAGRATIPGATITRAQREMLATAVSAANDCFFCMDSHAAHATRSWSATARPSRSRCSTRSRSAPRTASTPRCRRCSHIARTVRRDPRALTQRGHRMRRCAAGRERRRHPARDPDLGRLLDVQPTRRWLPRAHAAPTSSMYSERAGEIAEHGYSGDTAAARHRSQPVTRSRLTRRRLSPRYRGRRSSSSASLAALTVPRLLGPAVGGRAALRRRGRRRGRRSRVHRRLRLLRRRGRGGLRLQRRRPVRICTSPAESRPQHCSSTSSPSGGALTFAALRRARPRT